jgi:hypothetical protein
MIAILSFRVRALESFTALGEAWILAKERQNLILESIGNGAGVHTTIDLKRVHESTFSAARAGTAITVAISPKTRAIRRTELLPRKDEQKNTEPDKLGQANKSLYFIQIDGDPARPNVIQGHQKKKGNSAVAELPRVILLTSIHAQDLRSEISFNKTPSSGEK